MLVASSMMLAAFAPAQKADDKMGSKMSGKMAGKMDGKAGKSKMTAEQKAAWDKAHPRNPKTGKFIKKSEAKTGPARDAKGRFIKKDAKAGDKPAATKPKMKMGDKIKAGMDKMKAKMKGGDKK